jgi:AsmA-like C-terminal region
MRGLKIVGAILAVVALIVGIGFFVLDRYLQSPAFKQAVVRSAHDLLGSDVRIGDVRISILSGATLSQVALANPPGFPGDLLRADALVVRYRLWPLLHRRLEIQRVALEGPVVLLTRGEGGEWNYERLGGHAPGTPARGAPRTAPVEPSGPSGRLLSLDVLLPELTVRGGSVVVTGERQRPLLGLDQLDLDTSLTWLAAVLRGGGRVGIGTLSLADTLFVRQMKAPLALTPADVKLTPLSGGLAGGELTGDLGVTLAGGLRYTANLQLRNVDVQTLVREARARRRFTSGRLQGRARLEGSGGLPTLTGQGHFEVQEGQLVDVPILQTAALLLQVPSLYNLKLDECSMDWTLAGEVLQTPSIRLMSRDVRITGAGAVSLAEGTVDHALTLALPKATVARAPRDVRRAFTEQPDGWMTVAFRVWGPYEAPRTDLSDRLLRGTTEDLLRKGFKQLFR